LLQSTASIRCWMEDISNRRLVKNDSREKAWVNLSGIRRQIVNHGFDEPSG